jgi:hypothetical protein
LNYILKAEVCMNKLIKALSVACIAVLFTGTASMAQDAGELQKQIEELKKKKELLDAEKQLLDAQKALADAQKSPSAYANEVAAAQAAKELADAQKALADAKKALSDAELSAFKAALGEVPSSGITGAVDLKGDQAGKLEATLLAMTAVSKAGYTIAWRISQILETGKIAVLSASDALGFSNMILYDAEREVVRAALDNAIKAVPPPPGPELEALVAPPLAVAGYALDAAGKLLSFFKSDYSVQGFMLTVEDAAAIDATAGELAALRVAQASPTGSGTPTASKASASAKYSVTTPMTYDPKPLENSAKFFVDDIIGLSKLAEEVKKRLDHQNNEIQKRSTAPPKETPAGKKEREAQLAKHNQAAGALKASLTLLDNWYTRLSAPDSKGVAALVHVAREKSIAQQAKEGHLLLLKVQTAGGASLTKKNLWTALGGMPMYHMGGAAVSYRLLNGKDGTVVAAGVVPVHGGFVKAGKLAGQLIP